MPCMPRRILPFAGLFSGSSGVAPSAGHCRPPPTTPLQPTPARRPGSATPAATGVCSAERTNKSRPISPSLRTRHEIIPSRAGDGRHSKARVHSPPSPPSKVPFHVEKLRSAWLAQMVPIPRLAFGQPSNIPQQKNPALTHATWDSSGLLCFACRGLLDTTSGVGPPVHL